MTASPMQFRMSTLKMSVHGLLPTENTHICRRKSTAIDSRNPERRMACHTLPIGVRPFFTEESIRNPSVTPVRKRNTAGVNPPMNCDKM